MENEQRIMDNEKIFLIIRYPFSVINYKNYARILFFLVLFPVSGFDRHARAGSQSDSGVFGADDDHDDKC